MTADIPSFGIVLGEEKPRWTTNAQMIADGVAPLGFGLHGAVLDLTYGLGKFWSDYRPADLTTNDINPAKPADNSYDVRGKPPGLWMFKFDAVVLDIPYGLSGRRDKAPGKGDGDFSERFGLEGEFAIKDTEVNPLLETGTQYAINCRAKNGFVHVKCQDQQWRNKLCEQTDIVRQVGKANGLRVVERFHLPTRIRKQRSQKSARNNYSTLVILGR